MLWASGPEIKLSYLILSYLSERVRAAISIARGIREKRSILNYLKVNRTCLTTYLISVTNHCCIRMKKNLFVFHCARVDENIAFPSNTNRVI